jgi:curved DNA-binding protein
MAAKDLYAALGVPKDVSADDLKKAYRKLTRRFHPDRNPGNKQAEERFKEVSNAYDILSEPSKRALYDEFGEMSLTLGFDADRARRYKQAQAQAQADAARGPHGFDDSDLLEDIGDPRATNFDDFLSRMFGRRSGGAGPQRRGSRAGIDIAGEIHVAMMDALAGTTVQMRVEVSDGDQRSITVRVPAGIGDGGKLRVRGHGGAGDPPGDLILTVVVEKHPRISREGDDLRMSVPVTAFEAYRGGPVDVKTPWGTVALKLPAGAQNGSTLRVRGHGVRVANKPPGDLLVVLDVRLPPPGNAKLLEALADAQAGQDPRSAAGL